MSSELLRLLFNHHATIINFSHVIKYFHEIIFAPAMLVILPTQKFKSCDCAYRVYCTNNCARVKDLGS